MLHRYFRYAGDTDRLRAASAEQLRSHLARGGSSRAVDLDGCPDPPGWLRLCGAGHRDTIDAIPPPEALPYSRLVQCGPPRREQACAPAILVDSSEEELDVARPAVSFAPA
eukprot:1969744-Alexandrium_andersonii.AAC.1